MDTSSVVEDSDSEVFEGNHNTSISSDTLYTNNTAIVTNMATNMATMTGTMAARTQSSSSSRRSSYENESTSAHESRPTVANETNDTSELDQPEDSLSPSTNSATVEWKPDDGGLSPPSPPLPPASTGGDVDEPEDVPEGDLKAVYGATLTVTIDPPRDDEDGNDVISEYLDGGSGSNREHLPLPSKGRSLAELFGDDSCSDGIREADIYESLNDLDMSEEEDCDPPPPTKICLLSK